MDYDIGCGLIPNGDKVKKWNGSEQPASSTHQTRWKQTGVIGSFAAFPVFVSSIRFDAHEGSSKASS